MRAAYSLSTTRERERATSRWRSHPPAHGREHSKRDDCHRAGAGNTVGPTNAAQLAGRACAIPARCVPGDPGAVRTGHRSAAEHHARRPVARRGRFVAGRGPVLRRPVPTRGVSARRTDAAARPTSMATARPTGATAGSARSGRPPGPDGDRGCLSQDRQAFSCLGDPAIQRARSDAPARSSSQPSMPTPSPNW